MVVMYYHSFYAIKDKCSIKTGLKEALTFWVMLPINNNHKEN